MKKLRIVPPEGYEVDKENSTFECIKFKPIKELPTTWEEFCKTHPLVKDDCWINTMGQINYISGPGKERLPEASYKNLLPSKDYAEAILALCQLLQLRDCYNDGWRPDWSSAENKECIEINSNEIIKEWHRTVQRVLVFKSVELRDKFLENFQI